MHQHPRRACARPTRADNGPLANWGTACSVARVGGQPPIGVLDGRGRRKSVGCDHRPTSMQHPALQQCDTCTTSGATAVRQPYNARRDPMQHPKRPALTGVAQSTGTASTGKQSSGQTRIHSFADPGLPFNPFSMMISHHGDAEAYLEGCRYVQVHPLPSARQWKGEAASRWPSARPIRFTPHSRLPHARDVRRGGTPYLDRSEAS